MGRPRKEVSIKLEPTGEVTLMEQVVTQEEKIDGELKEENVITQNSPEWNDYVLTKLAPFEFVDGKPKVDGLRRVARLLLGKLIRSKPINTIVTDFSTTVMYEVAFMDENSDILEFGGCADVNDSNCQGIYARYRAAVAETRAEGRALRKALGIRVVCAEEVNPELAVPNEDIANATQLAVIKNLCNQMKINVDKFGKMLAQVTGKKYDTLETISYDLAIECIQRLNQYQSSKSSKTHKDIPEEVLV